MLNNKEILNNSSFTQEVNQLNTKLRVLEKLPKVFLPKSNIALKLKLHERIIDYASFIVLSIYNTKTELHNHIDLKENNEVNKRILKSYLELAYNFGLCEKKNTQYKFTHNKEEGQFDFELFEKSIEREDYHCLAKIAHEVPYRRLYDSFFFIYVLIKIAEEEYLNDKLLKATGVKSYWIDAIKEGYFSFQLKLCASLLDLFNTDFKRKINSRHSESYFSVQGKQFFSQYIQKGFENLLHKLNKKQKIEYVLDIGCGYGDYLQSVHDSIDAEHLYGIETQRAIWQKTRERFSKYSHISVINQNVFDYNSILKFDLIVLSHVLHYFNQEDKRRLFKQISYLLTSHGRIVICQFFPGIESLKKKIAVKKHDVGINCQLDMFYANKMLYANAFMNESLNTFKQSEQWDELLANLEEFGFEIESAENADRYYYSVFLVIRKKEQQFTGMFGEGI